jgi:prophage regulatory protein
MASPESRITPDERMLRPRDVCAATGLSYPTIWRRVKSRQFPQPRKLGPNMVGWPASEIFAWRDALPLSGVAAPEKVA